VVRIPPVAVYPLWQDEVASARIMIEPTIGAALGRVEDTESTPPLWYGLAWIIEQAGFPVEAARLIGLVSSALLAGLLVVYARRLLPLWAAGLAGFIVALASQLVLRGAELRAYALYALLALVFAWLLERAAERASWGRLAALAAVTAAGLLTHYFFALVALAAGAWLWTTPAFRRTRLPVSVSLAAAVLPFLLWLPSLVEQVENQRFSWIGDFSLLKAVAVYSAFGWNAGPLYVRDLVQIGALDGILRVAVFLAVVAGCVLTWRLGPRGRLTAILALAPTGLVALLWVAGENLFTARNVLACAPFAAVAIAALVAALPQRWGRLTAALCVLVVAGGLAREIQLAPPPYHEIADELVEFGWDDDPVAIFGGVHELSYLGSAYAVRGPVGWYLPGHPQLVLSQGGDCEATLGIGSPEPPSEDVHLIGEVEAGLALNQFNCPAVENDLPRFMRRHGGFLFEPADD
jgi:dolichyl-phosphate-mannose-protein mannosyltransferase